MLKDIFSSKVNILLTVIVVLLVVLAVWFAFEDTETSPERMAAIDVYRLNINTGTLVPRPHHIPSGTHEDMVHHTIDIFARPSGDTVNLRTTFPEGMTLLSSGFAHPPYTESGILVLDFSAQYHYMTPSQELYFRSSLVWTMTGLDFVSDVHIFIEGQEQQRNDGTPMGLLNRTNLAIAPQITATQVDFKRLVIYFIDPVTMTLVPEERILRFNPLHPLGNYYIEALIQGPQDQRLQSPLSSNTRLRTDVQHIGETAYVNLSNGFISHTFTTDTAKRLHIMSVVNSLTGLSGIYRVQFLIDSETITKWDLNTPIERDETLIIEVY